MSSPTALPFADRFMQAFNLTLPAEGEVRTPTRRRTLLRDLHRLGLAHATLLRASRGPGDIRSGRRMLRVLQVLGALSLLNLPLCGMLGTPAFCWLLPFVAVLFFKKMIYGAPVAMLMPTSAGRGAFWLLQFPADLAYTAGLLRGVLSFSRPSAR
jgi:hypothetical protein